MTALQAAIVFHELPRIVTDHCRNAVSRGTHRLDSWVVSHDD